MKNIIFLIISLLFLTSCGGLNEAGKVLRNEKVTTTDEFLVKKKNPLVLPPNFEEIPKPGSVSSNEENEGEKIKKILKAPKVNNSINNSSTIEESILDRIRK